MKLQSLRQRPLVLALHLSIAIGAPTMVHAGQLVAIGEAKNGVEVDGKTFDTGTAINADGTAVIAAAGGQIRGQDVVARSGGDAVATVVAEDQGAIALSGSEIVASGANSIGALAGSGGSLTLEGGKVTTTNAGAVSVAAVGGDVRLNGGNVRSAQGTALMSLGAGSVIHSDGTTIVGSGDNQAVVASVDGGQVVLTGGSVTSNGSNYASAFTATGNGSLIDAKDVTIDAFGTGTVDEPVAIAVALSGGQIALDGSTANTDGSSALGLWSEGTGSLITATNTTITTGGANSVGGLVRTGGALALDGASVTTHGPNAEGLQAFEGGRIEAANTDVSTSGPWATGLSASTTGAIGFQAGNIATTGDYSDGVLAQDDGHVTLIGTKVSTSGHLADAVVIGQNSTVLGDAVTVETTDEESYAVYAFGGGQATLENATIKTAGGYSPGVIAVDSGSYVGITGGSVTTFGESAYGIGTNLGGAVTATDTAFTTHGQFASGMFAFGAGSSIDAVGVTVVTDGEQADGATANTGGQVRLRDSSVTTSGDGAYGLAAIRDGSLVQGDHIAVTVAGSNDAVGAAAISGGTVRINSGSRIENTGASPYSHAAVAFTSDANFPGATFEATDSTLVSARGLGVAVNGGAIARLTNTTVEAGRNAVGFEAPPAPFDRPAIISISGGSLRSAEATVGAVSGTGTVTFANGVQITSDNGVLAQVNPAAALTLNLDSVQTAGNLFANTGGTLDFNLLNGTSLTGSAFRAGAATIDVGSIWVLTSDSDVASMHNNGTVAFAPLMHLDGTAAVMKGAENDFELLEVNGNYASNNGRLVVNTFLSDDTSPTDKLIVHGDTEGDTTVIVRQAGGKGALTSNGIQVVQVDGASNGTFALDGRVTAGAYEYRLAQGGKATPADGDWYLRSEVQSVVPPTPVTPDPVAVDPTPEVINPTPVATPLYRPEPAAYLANQSASVRMFEHSMHDRMGEPNLGKQGDDGRTSAAWVRVVRNQMDGTTGEGQLDAGTDTSVLQIGGEIARANDSRFHIGLMGGTGRANTEVTSTLLDWRARGKVTGYNLGVYGSWFADAKAATGLYLDGWLQYGSYDNKVHGDVLATERYDSKTWAASIEAGYAIALNDGGNTRFFVEPQAQAIFTDYSASQHRENNGTLVDDVDAGGLTTRLGVRFFGHASNAQQSIVQPFVTLNWWHDDDRNRMSFNDTTLALETPRDRYEAKLGLQSQLGGGWTGWGNLGLTYGARDYRDVTGQLGLNYRW